MGHRQQMTDKQRLQWDIHQYNSAKASKRGHNFSYLTDALHLEFEKKGYEQCKRIDGRFTYNSESAAVGDCMEFRRRGYYARVVCISNRLRIKEYAVFFKLKPTR